MKSLVTLLITVFASAAFAGGSGGGGVMMNNFMVRPDRTFELGGAGGGGGVRPGMQTMAAKQPEIVYSIRQSEESVIFAHAQLINNKWQIERFSLPKTEFTMNEEFESALKLSQQTKQWIEIK
ncbi:MAG: hypothetical protein JSU04_20125 [Bdellovibrionales bacterium]|nr:hypothetical protein [Bdellovibrionales bacterium]